MAFHCGLLLVTMKPWVVASVFGAVVLTSFGGEIEAAPGDPRFVSGTIEWPQSLADERFLIMKIPDGARVYVDVGSAHRWTAAMPGAGDTLTVIAVAGRRPYELNAIIIGDVQPAADGGAASPPSDAGHRLDGRVESVKGTTLVLRVNGRPITVDVARVRDEQRPRPGATVTVFGAQGAGGRFVATGLVDVSAPAVPADSAR